MAKFESHSCVFFSAPHMPYRTHDPTFKSFMYGMLVYCYTYHTANRQILQYNRAAAPFFSSGVSAHLRGSVYHSPNADFGEK